MRKTQNNRRSNVIDFSKKKRDLSHIQSPKPPKKNKIKFKFNGLKVVKVVAVLFLLLLMALSTQMFLNSNSATIQAMSIDGNFLLEEQEILSHLPEVGQANFFSTNKKQIEEAVVGIKWIKKVDVEKNIFNRSFQITVEERRPLYKIMQDDEIHIIDEEGVVLPALPTIVGLSVPIVVGPADEVMLGELVETFKPLPNHFLHLIAEVNIDNPNLVYLYTLDNFIIQIGDFSNLTQERVDEIIQIMKLQKNQNKTGIIDVRGKNIIFKPLEGNDS